MMRRADVVYGPDGYSVRSHRNRGIRKRVTSAEREAFLDELDRAGPGPECIEWPWGSRDKHGYARLGVDGKRVFAHRWVYEQAVGTLPDDIDVLHSCDNPPCVRHLFLGTQADNMADKVAKGRQPFGERIPSAVLSLAQVTVVLRLAAIGMRQAEVARVASISPQQVSRIVRGDRWAQAVRAEYSNVRA